MKMLIYCVVWFVIAYILFYMIGFWSVPIVIAGQIIQGFMKAHREYKAERERVRDAIEQVRHEELLEAIKNSKHKD